jgi:arylsulfatase A-like enzyme
MKIKITAFLLAASLTASAAVKPNIVIIMADDMGFSDIGCYGSMADTPHLDSLARNGLRFTDFHNTSRCCPTRASLLTGLYPHRAGVGLMTQDEGKPGYRGRLNESCVTLAEVLKTAGYTTLMTGKWHVGNAVGHQAPDRGFDRFWGSPGGGGFYFKDAMLAKGREIFSGREKIDPPDDLHVTDAFTDHAIGFVTEAVTETRKPFFLYIAHIAPHWPLQARPEEIAPFKGRFDHGWDVERKRRFAKQQELGLFPAGSTLSPRDAEANAWATLSETQRADLAHRMEIYAAQVDSMDRNIGKLIAKLKELGQFENTLILFLSDNGCSAEGGPGGFSNGEKDAPIGTGLSHASAGLEWANVSNTPFRQFKMSTFQGGTATPLIAHWPAGIPAQGEFRRQPGHVIDFMPTLVEITGATYPETFAGNPVHPMEGQSLAPLFRADTDAAPRVLFWEHMGNKAVRRGNWRLIQARGKSWQLFDLSSDPTETTDLAGQQPGLVDELKTLWREWAERSQVLR